MSHVFTNLQDLAISFKTYRVQKKNCEIVNPPRKYVKGLRLVQSEQSIVADCTHCLEGPGRVGNRLRETHIFGTPCTCVGCGVTCSTGPTGP